MSYEVCVFLRDEELPSWEIWQQALLDAGMQLQLQEFVPREHIGFLPTLLNGHECGFEYSFAPIEPGEPEELLAEIGDRNRIVTLIWHSNEFDMRAGLLAAAALARLTDGVFFDPQSGEFARGQSALTLLEQHDSDERDRRVQIAEKKWAHTTSRRCPKCGAPCPEYRGKCFVCEFEIGRV